MITRKFIYISTLAALPLIFACTKTTDTAPDTMQIATQAAGMTDPITSPPTSAQDLTRGPAPTEPDVPVGSVELVLKDKLDGDLSGYCFDILGGGRNIDPSRGLQAHTCYSYRGALGSDQAIDPLLFKAGIIKISAFNVCATVKAPKANAKLTLEACDSSPAQTFNITTDGHIRPPGDTDLCMTAGMETVRGRNGTSPHQIKTLTMQPCSERLTAYQSWRTRETKED